MVWSAGRDGLCRRCADGGRCFTLNDFLLDVLRAITIPIVYTGLLYGGFIVLLLGLVYLFIVPNVIPTDLPEYVIGAYLVLVAIISVILLVLLPLNILRFTLAVPVTVIENRTVLESLKRSWQMTVPCRIRFFLVFLMAELLILIGSFVLWLPFTFFSDDPLFWTYDLFGPTLTAIVLAVCYCYLRSSEVGITIHYN